MMEPGRIDPADVHAGALAHRLEPLEDRDVGRGVLRLRHRKGMLLFGADRGDLPALDDLQSLASALPFGDVLDSELALATLDGHDDHVRALGRSERADDAVVFAAWPHQIDSLPRPRELRNLGER